MTQTEYRLNYLTFRSYNRWNQTGHRLQPSTVTSRPYTKGLRRVGNKIKDVLAVIGFVSGGLVVFWIAWKLYTETYDVTKQISVPELSTNQPGRDAKNSRPLRLDLPTYTTEQVAEHDTMENGAWAHYDNGVYNLTPYVRKHPGGLKILMAAGRSLKPFWDLYPKHDNSYIYDIMEGKMRVGNIFDNQEAKTQVIDLSDPYSMDPKRNEVMREVSHKPYQSEMPSQLITDKILTPNGVFFVCNHKHVPRVHIADYSLELQLRDSTHEFTFDDLKTKYKKSQIMATIQCVKNRGREMSKAKEIKGPTWTHGGISTTMWSGVTLDDLLVEQGVDIDQVKDKFVNFEGMDIQDDGLPYGASIPIDLARRLKKEILIAYEMDHLPIPRDHGYPVRVIIPGVAGARHVKWLKKISFSMKESESNFQKREFKISHSSEDVDETRAADIPAITQLPVTSAICEPVEGFELHKVKLDVMSVHFI